MTKPKSYIAIIFSLALVLACAYLPKTVSIFLDQKNTGNASFNPITSIRFEIGKNIPSLGKLAMLSRMNGTIGLSEDKAKMTKEEVMAAIHVGLQPYIDAQLVAYSENEVQLHPSLIQVQNHPELQSIVWIVTITADFPSYTYFDLMIDDETGHILLISYASDGFKDALVGTEALSAFADIYFTSLGINDYMKFVVPDLEYAYVGDNAVAMRYRFGDTTYGEVNVDLFVIEHGFYIQFPRM